MLGQLLSLQSYSAARTPKRRNTSPKMIGEKHTLLVADTSQKLQPIIKPADLAHLEQDLFVICDDGAIRLCKNFYFK